MAVLHTSTLIYLGQFADMDTDEASGDYNNEAPELILGTYDKDDLSFETVIQNDGDESGTMSDDEYQSGTPDTLEFDLGSGTIVSTLDSTSKYRTNITLKDGSVITPKVYAVQTQSGHVFLGEVPGHPIDGLEIESIELDYLESSNYAGAPSSMTIENSSVACFAPGTQIDTPQGPVNVEDLTEGMLVCTADHGNQPVRWIDTSDTQRAGKDAYILIGKNGLGTDIPQSNLRVSPQHRIMVNSKIVERMTGQREMLIAAKHLLGLPGVSQSLRFLPTRYHHFACDNHEIVFANGVATETFYAGKQALKNLTNPARKALKLKIPKLAKNTTPTPARAFLGGAKARQLVARHVKNDCHLAAFKKPKSQVYQNRQATNIHAKQTSENSKEKQGCCQFIVKKHALTYSKPCN